MTWVIPTLISLVTLVYILMPTKYDHYGADMTDIIYSTLGTIISLISWLIWSLFN